MLGTSKSECDPLVSIIGFSEYMIGGIFEIMQWPKYTAGNLWK